MRPSTAAVTYPIAGDAAERPLLAVWLLLALSVVVPVLPAVPVVGYLVRVLAATERGESIPPFLAEPRTLARRSVGGAVVSLAYLGVPFAALLVTLLSVATIATAGLVLDTPDDEEVATVESVDLTLRLNDEQDLPDTNGTVQTCIASGTPGDSISVVGDVTVDVPPGALPRGG